MVQHKAKQVSACALPARLLVFLTVFSPTLAGKSFAFLFPIPLSNQIQCQGIAFSP